jgi:hypothetical protein
MLKKKNSKVRVEFLGFWTLSIVRYFKGHTTFRKMDLFPSLGVIKRGGKTHTQLGPLEITGRWIKSRNPEIPCAIHYRQNPSETKVLN